MTDPETDPTAPDGEGGKAAAVGSVAGDAADVDLGSDALVLLDVAATAVFLLVTAAAAVLDGDAFALVNLVVCAVLFVVGSVIWAWGFVRAAARSRDDVIDLAGLFYLTGSAPRTVRRCLLGLWFAQMAIAVVAIPLTSPPFGVMVPVFGIGVLTSWGASKGTFPARETTARPPRRRSGP
ncbi:MAG: hypothetical protein KDB02_12635 [Acidimicrobiales bacterium]|nr:hypothetical protein [Acidimicrobiales bacterium]